ncbi:MAG: PC4/YdbC family ssDNA-binding protein [Eubacteriales bacterium]|nr:PC4/YdbC family ssDNA-binding protein [Eubacteriales bacterium]
MSDLNYNIIKCLGIIGEGTKGWKKEVNIVSWNDREPKLDIRDWNEDHKKMGKGITLTNEEAAELKNLLQGLEPEELDF